MDFDHIIEMGQLRGFHSGVTSQPPTSTAQRNISVPKQATHIKQGTPDSKLPTPKDSSREQRIAAAQEKARESRKSMGSRPTYRQPYRLAANYIANYLDSEFLAETNMK